jgi:hypothetical protein
MDINISNFLLEARENTNINMGKSLSFDTKRLIRTEKIMLHESQDFRNHRNISNSLKA